MSKLKPDSFLPLFVADYLADTAHLTRDQHGAYLLLLMAYWRRSGPLPDDDEYLAQVCKATKHEWKKLKPVMLGFFEKSENLLRNNRSDREIIIARAMKEKKADNGRKGASARWQTHPFANGKPMANGMANTMANDSPSPSPSPTQEERKKKESQKRPPVGRTGDSNFFDFSIQIWTNAVAYLTSTGTDENDARGVIGKWRKEHSDEAILIALSKAEQNQAANPAGYVQTILNGKTKDYERTKQHDDGLDWLRDIADGNATINHS